MRWPDHPVVGRLCRELGPLAVTSANRHGSPPATTAGQVAAAFAGADELAVILDGGTCDGAPSTVVECRGPASRCLREGAIAWEEIVDAPLPGRHPGGPGPVPDPEAALAGSGEPSSATIRIPRALSTGGELVFSIIVVGTDGSETAGEAVALAVQLARQNNATLHLVVGVHSSAAVAVPVGWGQRLRSLGGSAAEAGRAEHAREHVREVRGSRRGDPHRCRQPGRCDRPGGRRGRRRPHRGGEQGHAGKRRILGSVPNSVAHKAGCHVLVAKTT